MGLFDAPQFRPSPHALRLFVLAEPAPVYIHGGQGAAAGPKAHSQDLQPVARHEGRAAQPVGGGVEELHNDALEGDDKNPPFLDMALLCDGEPDFDKDDYEGDGVDHFPPPNAARFALRATLGSIAARILRIPLPQVVQTNHHRIAVARLRFVEHQQPAPVVIGLRATVVLEMLVERAGDDAPLRLPVRKAPGSHV